MPIPDEDQPIMITPEHSGNRWLLPVRNLRKSPTVDTNEITPVTRENFQEQLTDPNNRNGAK